MPRQRSWVNILGWNTSPTSHHHDRWWHERRRLLPRYHDRTVESSIPPAEVSKVSIRLRRLVEECVPCELEECLITKPHSKVITNKVIKAAKDAGGSGNGACVVFCLLVCNRWFKHQALAELYDADLHKLRAVACEIIAKAIIEQIGDSDIDYLMHKVLLKRYSIVIDGEEMPPANVIERAVDLHALRVIGSSGYQKCINYLWRGWLTQDEDDPSNFIDYKDRTNPSFMVHLDPDRMRAPVYQNSAQLVISFIYLGLYTGAINTVNRGGELDFVEGLMYAFTVGFICDEITKFWKAGYHILGFWNALNGMLYGLLMVSLGIRFVALGKPFDGPSGDDGKTEREQLNEFSYNFLAVSAPLFWIRLLLYLDTFRFFGAMLVVLKVMMKESIIFFALLTIVIIGFFQSFIGLDYADDRALSDTSFIIQSMANAIMQSPDFSGFEKFSHPFGIILYYFFTFIVMVILLNVLIALYNSAYEDIYDNADDEFLALFAQKTMQFVRAPDENVYIAPFNLIEVFLVALPFEWWMNKRMYERLNDIVMAVLYSPLLLFIAVFEIKTAGQIRANRSRGEDDDDIQQEWEQMEADLDSDSWNKTIDLVKANVEEEPAVLEVQKLRDEVLELKKLILEIGRAVGAGHPSDHGHSSKGTNGASGSGSAKVVGDEE